MFRFIAICVATALVALSASADWSAVSSTQLVEAASQSIIRHEWTTAEDSTPYDISACGGRVEARFDPSTGDTSADASAEVRLCTGASDTWQRCRPVMLFTGPHDGTTWHPVNAITPGENYVLSHAITGTSGGDTARIEVQCTGTTALSESEAASLREDCDDEEFVQWDDVGGEWVCAAVAPGSGIASVVEDTSPQLGGALDAQGEDITGVGTLEAAIAIGAQVVSQAASLQDAMTAACSAENKTVIVDVDVAVATTVTTGCSGLTIMGTGNGATLTGNAGVTILDIEDDWTTVKGLTFTFAGADAANVAIRCADDLPSVSGCSNILIHNNVFEGTTQTGIAIDTRALVSSTISDNYIHDWDIGIHCEDQTGFDCNAVNMTGNRIQGNQSYGIRWVDMTSMLTLSGNTIEGDQNVGILCDDGAGVVALLGNHFEQNISGTGEVDILRDDLDGSGNGSCAYIMVGNRFGNNADFNYLEDVQGANVTRGWGNYWGSGWRVTAGTTRPEWYPQFQPANISTHATTDTQNGTFGTCVDDFNAGGPPQTTGDQDGLCDSDGSTSVYSTLRSRGTNFVADDCGTSFVNARMFPGDLCQDKSTGRLWYCADPDRISTDTPAGGINTSVCDSDGELAPVQMTLVQSDCSSITQAGTFCVDSDDDTLYYGNGSSAVAIAGGSGGTVDDISGDTGTTTGANVTIAGGTNGVDTAVSADTLTITLDFSELGSTEESALESLLDIAGEVTSTGMGSTVIADSLSVTSWTLVTPILSGKVDADGGAVNDDDCTGEQGLFWYDDTDSAFEFCNANSGTPVVLGGGSFDATTIDAVTWSDGANATNAWTFDVSGTDVVVTFGSAAVDFSGTVTATSFVADPTATPTVAYRDSDATAGDVNAQSDVNCTDTGDGTEDCDWFLRVQEAGSMKIVMTVDADDEVEVGSASVDRVVVTTDGTGDAEVVLPAGAIGDAEITAMAASKLTGSIDLGTGTIRGAVFVETTGSTDHTLTAAEGQWLFADEGGATEVNLPALSSGASVCVYITTAHALTIDPNGSEVIVLGGAAESAGEAVVPATPAAGDYICLLSNGTSWYALGQSGDWDGAVD